MESTKYSQRLREVEPIEFGTKAELEPKSWRAFEEEQIVIPVTRFYKPPDMLAQKNSEEKPTDQQMDAESSSQEHATPDIITKEEVRLMEEDHDLNYELYRGNTFAVGRLRSERYIFIPCGTHLTELRIVQLAHGRIKREGLFDNTIWINHPNSMAFGDLQTKVCLDLQDPIQQITVSSAIDVLKAEQSLMIIAVRTMSKTLLIKVERKKDDEPLTTSYLHEFVSPSPLVRPAHITPSPYTGQQYAMVDDNGSIFIYDIYSLHPLGIVFEERKLKQKENLNKRWISCIFGPNSRSLIVASSTEVTMLEYSADGGKLPRRLLFKCSSEDQQIHCLGGLDIRNSFLFCVGTDDYILLMDTRYPNQPVICWKHYLFDDPPRFMQLFKDKNDPDLVNVIVWSSLSTSALMLQYKYNGRLEYISSKEPFRITPAVFSKPIYIPFKCHKMKHRDEQLPIPLIGSHMEIEFIQCSPGDTKPIMHVFRMLYDGSLVNQIFTNTDDNNDEQSSNYTRNIRRYMVDRQDGIMISHDSFLKEDKIMRHDSMDVWESRGFFKDLIQNAVISKLSAPAISTSLSASDIYALPVPGSMLALVKPEKKKQLMVMNDLSLEDLDDTIQKHGYVKLKSESQPVNNSYWDPIPGQANITVSAQKAIRNSPCNSLVSMNPEQETNRRKLEDLFAKDMKTNLSYYLPANNTGNSPSRFEYLELDNPDAFKPNGSMLLLAQDWIPGNGSEITPPDLFAPLTDRGRPLFYRHKPSGTSDRSSSSQPVSAFSQSTVHLDSIATQPVPGAFAARPAKSKLSKKKKKKTTSV